MTRAAAELVVKALEQSASYAIRLAVIDYIDWCLAANPSERSKTHMQAARDHLIAQLTGASQ